VCGTFLEYAQNPNSGFESEAQYVIRSKFRRSRFAKASQRIHKAFPLAVKLPSPNLSTLDCFILCVEFPIENTIHTGPLIMTETMEATREPAPEKKERSRFRFRRGDKKRKKQSEKSESRQTAQVAKEAPKAVTRDGVPVVTASNADGFQPSDVHQTVPANKAHARGRPYAAERIVLDAPPAAKDAAFAGPPRYDWIDIVSLHFVLFD